MVVIAFQNLPSLPSIPFPNPISNDGDRVISFTTPQNYAGRVSHLLHIKGWTPLWCPTVTVESTPSTKSSIQHYLSVPKPKANASRERSILEGFSAIAFTSRAGISAFSEALTEMETHKPLAPRGEIFTISALGKDSELIDESFIGKFCENHDRIKVLVPPIATPSGLAESPGLGEGKRVLCPVPLVIELEEPPVVPNFLRDLASNGWGVVRLNAYETRWAGAECAGKIVGRGEEEKELDAIVFTSTAEVEGLLKSLRELGLNWEMVRKRWPALLVAAHGPVTASGAERLGVEVDVVSSKFESFDGIVDALASWWKSLEG